MLMVLTYSSKFPFVLLLVAVNIKHEGEESWNNMWQKIRSIWKYVHKNYRDDFDWFLLGGDDMFYIMENLKTYLESKEIVDAQKLNKGIVVIMLHAQLHCV
jgi:hypothetical protein